MKKQLPILLLFLSFNFYAQISFEKGYYIDNSGQRIECFIKNIDWKNNPTSFEYKLSESSEQKKALIESIKEFGIDNISKYSRFRVNVDRSSSEIGKLSTFRKPIFKEEELFLKSLVEGKANLYKYEDGNLIRYFYKTNTSTIQQLVFKNYTTTENKIGINNRYHQQLWNDLKCENFSKKNIQNISYKNEDLLHIFMEYNECSNSEYISFENKQQRDLFNLTIRPGLNSSSLKIQNSTSPRASTDFGNELGIRLGLEFELIMPFNKNKWSFIVEPTYQYFKSEKQLDIQSVIADYNSIELPIGVRHYLFLNEESKIFINASFVIDLSSNSKISFERGQDLDIRTRNNLIFGLGYKHNDKYSLELRYGTEREVLSDYVFWTSNYQTLSLILGYSIF